MAFGGVTGLLANLSRRGCSPEDNRCESSDNREETAARPLDNRSNRCCESSDNREEMVARSLGSNLLCEACDNRGETAAVSLDTRSNRTCESRQPRRRSSSLPGQPFLTRIQNFNRALRLAQRAACLLSKDQSPTVHALLIRARPVAVQGRR